MFGLQLKDLTIDHVLLGLICLFIIYIIYMKSKETFLDDNFQIPSQLQQPRNKSCSDRAINYSILDYQLSPLNQKKI